MTWRKGQSGNPRGRRRRSDAERRDGLTNALTGIGVYGKDKRLGAVFEVCEVTPEDAEAWWRGHDLAARIVETPVNEMLREGWCLKVAADEDGGGGEGDASAPGRYDARSRRYDEDLSREVSEEVTARLEDLEFECALRDALNYERGLGGGAVLLGVNDGQELDQPLNLERIIAFDWVTALERRDLQVAEFYGNPAAPKFGRPAIYEINAQSPGAAYGGDLGQMSGVRVHESRLLVFPGIQTTRAGRGTRIAQGWGDSVLTRCAPVLRDYDTSWSAASILLHDFSQTVYKLKDLAALVLQDSARADATIKSRLQALELSRSVARAVVIDQEEEFERKTTAITGLPEMLELFASRLAAAADMPLTLLMGQSPGGLNATGESDIRFFYDRIRSAQSRRLRPIIERVCKIVFATLPGGEPAQWSVEFKPLWTPSAKEVAETRFLTAQADEKYITAGVLYPEEVARARFGGDEYSADITVDLDARQELEVSGAELQVAGEVAAAEARTAAGLVDPNLPPEPTDDPEASDQVDE